MTGQSATSLFVLRWSSFLAPSAEAFLAGLLVASPSWMMSRNSDSVELKVVLPFLCRCSVLDGSTQPSGSTQPMLEVGALRLQQDADPRRHGPLLKHGSSLVPLKHKSAMRR